VGNGARLYLLSLGVKVVRLASLSSRALPPFIIIVNL